MGHKPTRSDSNRFSLLASAGHGHYGENNNLSISGIGQPNYNKFTAVSGLKSRKQAMSSRRRVGDLLVMRAVPDDEKSQFLNPDSAAKPTTTGASDPLPKDLLGQIQASQQKVPNEMKDIDVPIPKQRKEEVKQ